jgi:4'-phosphopantetheinyl transferase
MRLPLPLQTAPPLSSACVHLWVLRFSALRSHEEEMRPTLSAEETQRMSAYVREPDRRGFCLGRGALRHALAFYLECAPCELRLLAGPQGKPRLDAERHARRIDFNLSHSGDLLAMAFTIGHDIGIDVEKLDPAGVVNDPSLILDMPHNGLSDLTDVERTRVFFDLWTRQEALLKAMGCGLCGLPLSKTAARENDLSVMSLDLHPNYAAALAVSPTASNIHPIC